MTIKPSTSHRVAYLQRTDVLSRRLREVLPLSCLLLCETPLLAQLHVFNAGGCDDGRAMRGKSHKAARVNRSITLRRLRHRACANFDVVGNSYAIERLVVRLAGKIKLARWSDFSRSTSPSITMLPVH